MRFNTKNLLTGFFIIFFVISHSRAQEPNYSEIGWDQLTHFESLRHIPIGHIVPFCLGIEITPDGSVNSTCSKSRPALKFAGNAVSKWRFEPTIIPENRLVKLEIFYHPVSKSEGDSCAFFRFEEPLTLHVHRNQCTKLKMDRVDGVLQPAKCRKHKIKMQVEIIPLGHGLPHSTIVGQPLSTREVKKRKYERAKKKYFPNCPTFVFLPFCSIQEEKAEAFICSECRNKRNEWFEQHPSFMVEYF